MISRSVKHRLVSLVAYVALSLVLGFLPIYGPPHFRYTGSDPDYYVWNLGWPLATMILDQRTGIHVGPWAYFAFPAIILLGLAGCALLLGLQAHWRMKETEKHKRSHSQHLGHDDLAGPVGERGFMPR